ncbi:hypothetical protein PG994_008220 [Apiospora phragmitis]|uniref:Uncharacterized protein n=1 Tax=Apiospora phragmitis TaxID=2905665 RepID=A0ABR1USF0_9PEZI
MAPNWQTTDSFYELGGASQAQPSGFRAVKNVWYARARAHVTHDSSSPTATATQTGTATASPTSTDKPKPTGGDCDPSTFADSVSNVAVYVPGAPLQIAYPTADDAADCCKQCFALADSADQHCNGWGYIGGMCNIMYDYPGGSKDDTCPKGYPQVSIEKKGGKKGDTGGYGPCAFQHKGSG